MRAFQSSILTGRITELFTQHLLINNAASTSNMYSTSRAIRPPGCLLLNLLSLRYAEDRYWTKLDLTLEADRLRFSLHAKRGRSTISSTQVASGSSTTSLKHVVVRPEGFDAANLNRLS